jgi:hypothetical protein
MAKRRTDANRRDLATWLMMLLPGFMFVGLLAPAAVSVKPKAEEEIGPISFRHFAPRRPIQFSLPVGQGALSESGLESVFAGARYLVDQAKRVVEFDFKADDGGKQIVLNEDSVETYVAETLFEAPIDDPEPQLVVDLTPLWDPSVFDVIPDLIDRSGFTQWDDFHGTGVRFPSGTAAPGNVIPEPATGGLLAIGLAALAMRRRAD